MRDVVHRFLGETVARYPEFQQNVRVLEIGSYNINGTARDHFSECSYIGADWRPGPGVDQVGLAHELAFPDGSFDVVLSVETLEHDFYWRETLAAMRRMLRPGGLFMLTVASFDFPQHELDCASRPGYYHNVMPDELLPALGELELEQVDYREQDNGLFYAGFKRPSSHVETQSNDPTTGAHLSPAHKVSEGNQ